MLLGADLSYRGRALPRALYAYHPKPITRSLWAYREGLLRVILQAFSASDRARLLLIADRGYAVSHFFRRLLKSRVSFAIRVPRRVLLHLNYGTHTLEELAADLNCGECHCLEDVFYGPAKAKLNLLLWWEADQPEPWLIATTLPNPRETRRAYRLRMGIEEMFKDLKHSFALESYQCQSTARITRLGLFALLALWELALLVRHPQNWVRYITARGALSYLFLALE